MKCESIFDLQDKAFMCLMIFGGMNVQSIHDVKSKDVLFKDATDLFTGYPRHIELTVEKGYFLNLADVKSHRYRVGVTIQIVITLLYLSFLFM